MNESITKRRPGHLHSVRASILHCRCFDEYQWNDHENFPSCTNKNNFFFKSTGPYSKAQLCLSVCLSVSLSLSVSVCLSVCLSRLSSPFFLPLFCAILVVCHIIFITSHVLHVIVMPTFFQALDTKTIAQPKADKWLSSASIFSSFCVCVVL